MRKHRFIFKPGSWIGEGKITFSMIDEPLPFYTKWESFKRENGRIELMQEIQVSGLAEVMQNQFAFYDMNSKIFAIKLKNQSLGQVIGKGMINDQVIGWEFRLNRLGFEGFEFYEKGKTPKTYFMHAEYATNDDFRTVIHGKIWSQSKKSKL